MRASPAVPADLKGALLLLLREPGSEQFGRGERRTLVLDGDQRGARWKRKTKSRSGEDGASRGGRDKEKGREHLSRNAGGA